MATPRSAVIARQASTTPGTFVLTRCPPGLTLLVKSAYLYHYPEPAGTTTLAIGDDLGVNVVLFEKQMAARELASWAGSIVLEPGHVLWWTVAAPNIYVWVSGSVLQGTAQNVDLPFFEQDPYTPPGLVMTTPLPVSPPTQP
jgi:hypothetical protein